MRINQRTGKRSRWVAAICCAMLLLSVVGPMTLSNRTPQVSAAVLITPLDAMMAIPRGTPEKVVRFAQREKSTNLAETRAYIYEVYRMAPLVGLDPALVISQSALETANWTSFYWTNHLNPAGIGIGYSGAPSYTWASGTNAARFHLVRLYIYTAGALDPGNPLYPYREDGPSYQRVIDLGYNGQVKVLDDLTGKWATDPIYGQKVSNRGNGIYDVDVGDPSEPALAPVSISASAGNDPNRTRDGDLNTSWAVQGIDIPPPGGYVTYNFGEPVLLESIQWTFRRSGFADSYAVQTSDDGSFWTNANTYTDSTAWSWNVLSGSLSTTYIRIRFDNPNAAMTIGYLAEVEFYGHYLNSVPAATSTPYPPPTATNTPIATNTPTPTQTPAALAGGIIPIVASGGSGSGNWSGYVRDGSIRTTWQTVTDSPPSQAQVYVDLGRAGSLTGVEFVFRRTSGARSYQIRVSNDKRNWATVATFDYADPLVWQRAGFSADGRYVQFRFFNPRNAPALGYLAEVKVFGEVTSFERAAELPTQTEAPPVTASATAAPPDATPALESPASPTATAMPDVVTDPIPTASLSDPLLATPVAVDDAILIASLARTSNSGDATMLIDGDPATTWGSIPGSTGEIYVVADLGHAQHVGAIVFLPGPAGVSGQMHLEISSDGGTWSPVDLAAQDQDGGWVKIPIDRDARAVRIVFTNPDGADWTGGIAELRIDPAGVD